MSKISKFIDPDIHFRVLHTFEENPHITQRELAKKLGVSLRGGKLLSKSPHRSWPYKNE